MPPRSQSRDPRTHLGAFLGQQLREIRAGAGYASQEALAADLGTDRSVLGKAETGEYPPADAILAEWLDLCRVEGRLRRVLEGICLIARLRENPAQAQAVPWFETEAIAHTLRYWAPVIVPGMTQTSDYARELFAAMGLEETKISEYLDVRLGRQAIIDRPEPPDISVVLWEPVLHHQIGTAKVMREQLAHLVELSHRPWVSIQVLPSRLGANPGLGGPINLAATDTAPELLGSDALVEDQLTQDPAVVRKARATFSNVRGDALNRADSRSVLMKAMERWSE